MRRYAREYCYWCGHTWVQDWEDEPECPRCGYPEIPDEREEEIDEDVWYGIDTYHV